MYTTLLSGLEVLDLLATSEHPRGVTEIAHELAISKSSAHRLLQTLKHAGYVKQDSRSCYECTLKIWRAGSDVMRRLDVSTEARVQMKRLSKETGETILLAILENSHVTHVDRIDSPQSHPARNPIGQLFPAYCLATGKILLAFSSEKIVRAASSELKRYTARTITDPVALRTELERIRRLGYVINQGEHREGSTGLGAPIFDRSGRIVAALGIFGPSDRLTDQRLLNYTSLALRAAQSVSESLGYSSSRRVRFAL